MKYEGFLINKTIIVDEIISVYQADLSTINGPYSGDVHSFPEIVCVTKGIFKVMVDNILYTLKKGDIIMYAPNSYHIYDEESDASVLIISFRTQLDKIRAYYNRVITLSDSLYKDFNELMANSFEIFKSKISKKGNYLLYARAGVPPYKFEIFKKQLELFLLNLEEIVEVDNSIAYKKDTEFMYISQRLRENIEKNLSINDMAKLSAMSVSKLKLVVKKNIDNSPMFYFHRLKLEKAREYLQDGRYNITEISEMLGFNSVHYFSRFFKNHAGVSPNKYKNSMNNILISITQDTQ